MLIALDIKTRYYCGPLTRGLNKRQKARLDPRVTCVRNAEGKSRGRRWSVESRAVCTWETLPTIMWSLHGHWTNNTSSEAPFAWRNNFLCFFFFFMNKTLPQTLVTDKVQSLPLTFKASQEHVHSFPIPAEPTAQVLCKAFPLIPPSYVCHQRQALSLAGGWLVCAVLVCQPILLDFLPTETRAQRGM